MACPRFLIVEHCFLSHQVAGENQCHFLLFQLLPKSTVPTYLFLPPNEKHLKLPLITIYLYLYANSPTVYSVLSVTQQIMLLAINFVSESTECIEDKARGAIQTPKTAHNHSS